MLSKIETSSLIVGLCLLALVGCEKKSGTEAKPPSDAAVADKAPPQRIASQWFRVDKLSIPVAILEFGPTEPVKMTVVGTEEEVAPIRKDWPRLSQPGGFDEKMHVPPPDGKGRGPLSSVLFKPGTKAYVDMIGSIIESHGYEVEPIGPLAESAPKTPIKKLTVTRDNKMVGWIKFDGDKAELSMAPLEETSDMRILKIIWGHAVKAGTLRAYYTEKRDGKTALVSLEAKPGDPDYANVVRIWLLADRTLSGKQRFRVDAD